MQADPEAETGAGGTEDQVAVLEDDTAYSKLPDEAATAPSQPAQSQDARTPASITNTT